MQVQLTCHRDFHGFIRKHREMLIPKRNSIAINIYLDLDLEPVKYLKSMIKINKYLQTIQVKSFNFLPMRTSLIIKHIEIDTTAIVDLLVSEDDTQDLIDRCTIKSAKHNKGQMYLYIEGNYIYIFLIQISLVLS